jgi:hypothetical protein
MTIDEFFQKLSETPRTWVSRPNGQLVNDKGETIFEAVAGVPNGPGGWQAYNALKIEGITYLEGEMFGSLQLTGYLEYRMLLATGFLTDRRKLRDSAGRWYHEDTRRWCGGLYGPIDKDPDGDPVNAHRKRQPPDPAAKTPPDA